MALDKSDGMCMFVNILKLKPHQVYIKGLTEINSHTKKTHFQIHIQSFIG